MFTKAEIGKLSVEQREALAKFEFSNAQRRSQLLEQARGLPGGWLRQFVRQTAVVWLAVVGFAFILPHLDAAERLNALYVLCGLAFIDILIGMRIARLNARLNRRLDALLELLDFDRQHQNDNDGSKEKVG
jgi:hypothetical protein